MSWRYSTVSGVVMLMGLLKKTEKAFKRLALASLSPMLKSNPLPGAAPSLESFRRILIIRPEKLGDVMITLPVVEALNKYAPEARIDLLASPYSYPLVKDDARFANVFVYAKRPLADLRLLAKLRQQEYDCVLDLIDADSVTGLLLSQISARVAVRVGANKQRLQKYYHLVTESPNGHSIDRALQALAPLGIEPDQCKKLVPPVISAESVERADSFVAPIQAENPSARVIAYNLSAGKPTRLWPVDKCRLLVSGLIAGFPNDSILLIAAPADRTRALSVSEPFADAVSVVPDGWSILDVAALLAKTHLLISPDTSLVHIARSFDVPVVGLYPKPQWNLKRWRPYGQSGGVIVSNSDGDIFDIPVDAVVSEAGMMLTGAKVQNT